VSHRKFAHSREEGVQENWSIGVLSESKMEWWSIGLENTTPSLD